MIGLWCGGRFIDDASDLIRRYCGLPWSAGDGETWAWRYFDEVETGDPCEVSPIDVLAAGSLHSGLTKADLAFFVDHRSALRAWLADVDPHTQLADAPDGVLARVLALPEIVETAPLSLLSKVLHRKRPGLIPMFDRAIVDRYRKPGGHRGEAMWPDVVAGIRTDLIDPRNRDTFVALLHDLRDDGIGHEPTNLRLLDIAVWMSAGQTDASRPSSKSVRNKQPMMPTKETP